MTGPARLDDCVVDEQEEAQGSRKMDSELRTIGAMLRLLDELPEPAQARVVEYLSRRFRDSRADPCV